MNRKLFLICLLSLVSIFARAQTYVPFPAAYAIWSERLGQGEDHRLISYCFGLKKSDTTIGARTYHKLYKSLDTVLSETEYYGGIREAAKRIYFHDGTTELLLYDFNLNIGDTFRNPGFWPDDGIVSGTDSINIAGQYRKRYSFILAGSNTPWMFGNWIEGIGNGSIGGLLQTFALQPAYDSATYNLCFRQGYSWIYHNPGQTGSTLDCLPRPAALNDPEAPEPIAAIVPNPVTDISRLMVEGHIKFDRMDIYDNRGIKVRTYAGKGKSPVLIDRRSYTPGLYLYRLSHQGRVLGKGRFIVQ